MPELFDMELRALRRDRAARQGPELFLFERAFDDCLERIELMGRRFERALLIGCPGPSWPTRLSPIAAQVDCRDPGLLFASAANGASIVEDSWEPPARTYDLVVSIGTLDTINDLPLALRLIRVGMAPDALLIGALSGGETLPQLRFALRAADLAMGGAAPHIHPRIEPSALSPLLADAGYTGIVVDVDRMDASYSSLQRLVADLRAMGATNILKARGPALSRGAYHSAAAAFRDAGREGRTKERFEILHFAAWTPRMG